MNDRASARAAGSQLAAQREVLLADREDVELLEAILWRDAGARAQRRAQTGKATLVPEANRERRELLQPAQPVVDVRARNAPCITSES